MLNLLSNNFTSFAMPDQDTHETDDDDDGKE